MPRPSRPRARARRLIDGEIVALDYLFTEAEVVRLLEVVDALPPAPTSPVRRENLRLAIVILYTTGLRRGVKMVNRRI
jgi:hypothetical protein